MPEEDQDRLARNLNALRGAAALKALASIGAAAAIAGMKRDGDDEERRNAQTERWRKYLVQSLLEAPLLRTPAHEQSLRLAYLILLQRSRRSLAAMLKRRSYRALELGEEDPSAIFRGIPGTMQFGTIDNLACPRRPVPIVGFAPVGWLLLIASRSETGTKVTSKPWQTPQGEKAIMFHLWVPPLPDLV